jgi:hypothetical protein
VRRSCWNSVTAISCNNSTSLKWAVCNSS